MNPWQLFDSRAQLRIQELTARIELSRPALGVHELAWNGGAVPGQVLGVTVAEGSTGPQEVSTACTDRYVRDNDLVANFPQNESQPFTLHIYWRLAAAGADIVVLDTIVSLQTTLLECYPLAILTTELSAEEAWLVHGKGMDQVRAPANMGGCDPKAVLLRHVSRGWSYFETTHPDDLGWWRVESGDTITISRKLGGEFQEKGVIRRLRVRGAFMPCANDIEAARRLMEEFANSPPQLTA